MATYNNYRNYQNQNNEKIEFKLVEQLGVLETHKSGWAREVNIVAWNGNQPKFDIRDWDPEHQRMSRGITLYENEAIRLTKILAQRLEMDSRQQRERLQRVPASGQRTQRQEQGQSPLQPEGEVRTAQLEGDRRGDRADILFDDEPQYPDEAQYSGETQYADEAQYADTASEPDELQAAGDAEYEEEPLPMAAGNELF